jgi:hypothetical protein
VTQKTSYCPDHHFRWHGAVYGRRENRSHLTADFHKHSVKQSFGFKSRADLVLFALHRGFIAPLLP